MTAGGLSVIGTVEGSGERGRRRWEWGDDPELCLYRDRTVALLRRYLRSSVETGKVPSLLGMEFFRSHVTSYHFATFEDVVIFVHDVERCVARLDQFSRDLIARITLQEYTQEEAARLLGCSRRTVARKYPEALDHLSEFFLEVGLIRPFPPLPEEEGLDCQAGELEEKAASI